MDIIFRKRLKSKHLIVYKREKVDDYWIEADDFLIFHDLSHYAIEKTLNFKNAFWGLIKSGINPSIFENKLERDKILISNEAWLAECLANLFLIELTQGKFEDFQKVLAESYHQMYPEKVVPTLQNEEIESIRAYYGQLIQQWRTLGNDESIMLTF
jgi:hypothetical protein